MTTEPTRVAFIALGCAKNLVDSEKMLGQLLEAGCVLTDEDDAEAIVINTCGFLEASRAEADEVIQDALARRSGAAGLPRVVVAGCLVQRDGTALLDRHPGVDALVGVHRRDDVLRAVRGSVAKDRPAPDLFLGDYHAYTQLDTARLRLTPPHYAYLRLGEGCNQKCTFCTIPSIRGPLHSKPLPAVLAEARELIADGTVELNLIGQDTTSYGSDLAEGPGLAELLRAVNALPGVNWVRLLYVYPSVFTDEMIAAVADCAHVVPYIDIPLQHINDRVLKAMHRRVDRAATERLLDKLRTRIPGVSIRTTLIAGFPGETEAEFDELLQFVQAFGFDALGVFPYSAEPGTPAARIAGKLPPAEIDARVDALMAAQQAVAFARADARQGEIHTVLIDAVDDAGPAVARHAGQAPEVDAVTLVAATNPLEPGQLVRVRITGRQDYDLVAEPIEITLPVVNP